MPAIFSTALFIDTDNHILLARRKEDAMPFAGQWVLPSGHMGDEETAEEALARVAWRELRVTITAFAFCDTLYLDTEVGPRIENIFVVAAWEGKLGYRAKGEWDDARWFRIDQVPHLAMPEPVRRWLLQNCLGQRDTGPGETDIPVAWPAGEA